MSKDAGLDLSRAKRIAEGSDPETAAAAKAGRFASREYDLKIPHYNAPDGESYSGTLQLHVLGGDERINVSKMASSLLGGVSWDSTPPLGRQLAWNIAWLTFAVTEPPAWLMKWAQEDAVFLASIMNFVEAHEERYFRGDTGTGGDDPPEPNFQIVPGDSAGATTK